MTDSLPIEDATIFAMVPARIGSERLPYKNLALIDDQPLVSYALEAAKQANVFDSVYLNSDHEIFADIAEEYNVKFYHRPDELGSSNTTTDEFLYDFIESNPCDYVAIVNPPSPLQPPQEVKEVVEHFIKNDLDSLITVSEQQVHSVFNGSPVNFSIDNQLAKTQNLEPLQTLVYSIMMWDTTTFTENFEKQGYGLFCGETDFYPVSDLSGILVKHKKDLLLADAIVRGRKMRESNSIEYHELVDVSAL